MPAWTPFPHRGEYRFDAARVRALWLRLHAGDAEPLPTDERVLAAWLLFHNGEFEAAAQAGLAAGGDGLTVANKATCIHANYVEKHEKVRLELLQAVAARAATQAQQEPRNPNAFYWHAYALGRYSQGISVAQALARGLGGQVKEALETTLRLQPRHADAHVALGTFHAEVIDKVGALIAGMTHGARKETGLALLAQGLKLNPASAIGLMECANGLLMLEGEARQADATRLYEQAAACEPLDAAERLHLDLARAELAAG